MSEEESLRSTYANVNPALEQCDRDESQFNGILEGDDMPTMSGNIQALHCNNTTSISMEVSHTRLVEFSAPVGYQEVVDLTLKSHINDLTYLTYGERSSVRTS